MNQVKIVLLIIALKIQLDHGRIYNCTITSPCGCSSVSLNPVNQRIVGGEIVRNRVWNWMVSLQFFDRHICGASLINAEFAITAAHCLNDLLTVTAWTSILAGTNNLSDTYGRNVQRRVIKSIYIHPKYNDVTADYDIAIIKFSSLLVDNSSRLSFICLPESGIDPFVDKDDLVATGWGYTFEGAGVASDALRQVTVQAIPSNYSSCINAPIRNPKIKFCAGLEDGGKDTCQGDSGGPLMAFENSRWVLAGLTSSGRGCARPKTPGLYTRVSNFIPFIQSILNQHSTTRHTPTTTTTKKMTAKPPTRSETTFASTTTSRVKTSTGDSSSDVTLPTEPTGHIHENSKNSSSFH